MLNIKYPALYCPFPPARNPHAEAAYQHTLEWLRSFNLITDESAYKILRAAKIEVLIACCYPNASLESLKIITDYLFWLAIADDQFEKAGISKQPELFEPMHAQLVDIIFKGASLTDADTPVALALRDIWQRLHQHPHGTSEFMLRFAKTVEDYLQGVRWEALNNSQGITPDVATYIQIREFTFAWGSFFEFIYLSERLALPPEIMEHPMVKRLNLVANHIVAWANDILGVEKEIREGQTHNLVVVLQHEYQIPLQEAVFRAAELHNAEVRTFIELSSQLPSFGAEIDAELQRYLSGVRCWMRGHLDWYQESGRYRLPETAPAAA